MPHPQFRALLVEDDYATRQVLAAALQQGDLDVDVAESAWEAKRLINRFGGQYCCILLDLVLPDGHGTDIAKHVREVCADVPILVVTGGAAGLNELTVAEYSDVVRFVIRKPVDIGSISDLILALGRSKSANDLRLHAAGDGPRSTELPPPPKR